MLIYIKQHFMNRKILHGYRHLCTCIATLAIIQFSYICTIVHVVSLKISSMKTKPALLVNWPEETVAYLMLFVLVPSSHEIQTVFVE